MYVSEEVKIIMKMTLRCMNGADKMNIFGATSPKLVKRVILHTLCLTKLIGFGESFELRGVPELYFAL
jgi:hypothetical protein